jgi:pimeloyl-ACP methyl ester carboxylesterase
MDSFATAITELGYASWNIEYRALGTGGAWPVIFQDVGQAIDFARGFSKYGVDTDKVAIIGHSAGGHLALWAASRRKLMTDSPLYVADPLMLRGVISLAGIADVTANNACGDLADSVIGLSTRSPSTDLSARLRQTSPQQMLPTGIPSVMISGSIDGIVPPAMGNAYTTAATSMGDTSVHYVLQPLGHFELINPSATNWTLYRQALENFFRN